MRKVFFTIAMFHLVFFAHSQDSVSPTSSAQEEVTYERQYDVYRVYPPLSMTKEKMNNAQALNDLNPYYKPSWVRKYISVVLSTSQNGNLIKVEGKNDILTQEQKDLLRSADFGSDIIVKVQYMPENTLKHNDMKEFGFTFTVDAEKEATFPGGEEALRKYLKEHAIDKIPDGSFKGFDIAIITFTISEEGKVVDEELFQPTKNEQIDDMLAATIRQMPHWTPAEYANGTKTNQAFALIVGNKENCILNLLNIREERFLIPD